MKSGKLLEDGLPRLRRVRIDTGWDSTLRGGSDSARGGRWQGSGSSECRKFSPAPQKEDSLRGSPLYEDAIPVLPDLVSSRLLIWNLLCLCSKSLLSFYDLSGVRH